MFTNTPTIQTFRITGTVGTLRCNFTKLSRKTFSTFALKVTFFCLNAGAAVEARRGLTFVDDLIANFAAKARPTLARERAIIVEADAVIAARILHALVDVLLAEISRVASSTAVACKSADLIEADSIILTRLRLAIVVVRLASAAEETIQALTLVCLAIRRNPTRSVMMARILLAQWMRLDGRLAELPSEVIQAEAFVVPDAVFFAGSAVPARISFARRSQVFVAVLAGVARRAVTLVLLRPRYALSVHAREVQAVIHRLADEHIVVGIALTVSEGTRAEQDSFN